LVRVHVDGAIGLIFGLVGVSVVGVKGREEPTIAMVTMDYLTGEGILTRSDGKEARWLVSAPAPDSEALARVHTTPEYGSMLAITKTGDEVLIELPRSADAAPLDGRPVVYLDQNQWSAVANAMHEQGKVSQSEQAAALQLARWASQGRVVLPASAGHYHETTKRFDDDKRYRLGLTIVQLGRGWQMRDPLQVRRDELRARMIQQLGLPGDAAAGPVFTLDPRALYAPSRSPFHYQPGGDLPPDLEFSLRAIIAATTNISVMLDCDRIADSSPHPWAGICQRFSDWLDGEQSRDRHQKRASIDAFLLSDLSHEIAEEAMAVGATPQQMSTWVQDGFGSSVSRMPATGLFREMLHERHLNTGTTWRPNDLTDMIYLSCAAGYADFVVTERHMRAPLAQGVRRLERPVRVFRHIADLIGPLADTLPPTTAQSVQS
jgi:hypothetical protein